jgi:hypothetical protein
MKLGVIYNSDGNATDAVTWNETAKRNFDIMESQYGIVPDQAIFVSWNKYPTRAMPETLPSAHTWLIRQYLLPRSRFIISTSAPNLRGQLVGGGGRGIAGATVRIDRLGADPDRYPTMQTISATVPADATSAVVALRINQECLCAGDNDVLIGDFQYAEHGGGAASFVYHIPAEAGKGRRPRTDGITVHPAQIDGHDVVRVTVPANGKFGLTSQKFSVTPKAEFTFKVPMVSLTTHGIFGGAAIIWLSSSGDGLRRTNVNFEPEVSQSMTLKTDATGHFEARAPYQEAGRPAPLRLYYAGSNDVRAAYATVQ